MDDISRDAGWAAHDDIDYNQKLSFSDEELDLEPSKKDDKKDMKEEKSEENNSTDDRDKTKDNRDNYDNRDSKEPRDQPMHRPWTQSSVPRDYRGSNGSGGYSGQPPLHSVHSLRGQNIYMHFDYA